jgi:predicted transcriptional regulator
MRQIREVLRPRYASKLPQRAIAKSLGLSQGAVSGYLLEQVPPFFEQRLRPRVRWLKGSTEHRPDALRHHIHIGRASAVWRS